MKNTQKNSKTFPHEGFRPMPGSLLGYLDGCFLGCGACRCLGLLGVLLFYAIVSFSRFIAEFGCVVVVVYCCVLFCYLCLLVCFIFCCCILLIYSIVLFSRFIVVFICFVVL